jgi:Rieske Fe-S protein
VIAPVSAVAVGASAAVTLPNGAPVAIARPDANTVVCFSAICTHQGCTVAPDGPHLACPCHGSIFNAFTGAVVQGPASSPLPQLPVHISGSQIVTDQPL